LISIFKIPPSVSAIIMKLLSKTPGERYQSASGLLADLEECRWQWSHAGAIVPFILGRFDFSDRFQFPRKLYGREKEVESLYHPSKVEIIKINRRSKVWQRQQLKQEWLPQQ
jgi:serine/threonine protein kinase